MKRIVLTALALTASVLAPACSTVKEKPDPATTIPEVTSTHVYPITTSTTVHSGN